VLLRFWAFVTAPERSAEPFQPPYYMPQEGEGRIFIARFEPDWVKLETECWGPCKATKALWPPRFLAIIFNGCSHAQGRG
jgi:hypothetical protein